MNEIAKRAAGYLVKSGSLTGEQIINIIQAAIDEALDKQGQEYAVVHQKHIENLECYLYDANQRIAELEKALELSMQYISNGIELGYISPPDDDPESEKFLSRLRQALKGGE